MSNTHYVCFPCRTAVKRAKSWCRGDEEHAPRCPHCGGACTELDYRAPVPPKNKGKAWAALFARTLAEQRQIGRASCRERGNAKPPPCRHS